MLKHLKNRKALLAAILLIMISGLAALGVTFSSQITYTGDETLVEAGKDYNVAVEYIHSNNYNAKNLIYKNLLTAAVFTDVSTFCPNRTEILYIRLTNSEAFPVNYTLSLRVKENGFGNTMTYAALQGQNLLADQKKLHPASWQDFLTSANAAPRVLSINTGDQLHPVAEKVLLGPGETTHLALAVHMDQEAGNEYQSKDLKMHFVVRFDADYNPGDPVSK